MYTLWMLYSQKYFWSLWSKIKGQKLIYLFPDILLRGRKGSTNTTKTAQK